MSTFTSCYLALRVCDLSSTNIKAVGNRKSLKCLTHVFLLLVLLYREFGQLSMQIHLLQKEVAVSDFT